MANASSPRFRLLAGIGRRAAAVGVIAMLNFVIFAATPATACDLLDPTCAVEVVEDTADSSGTVDDATGGVTATVDETEETTGTIDETVEETTGTIESVVGQAEETVDETVGSGIGPVDDVIGNPSVPGVPGADPVQPPTVNPGPSAGGNGGNGSDGDGSGIGDQPPGPSTGGVAGPFVLDPFTLEGATVSESTPTPRGFLDFLAGPAGQIASRIAFPLALALLVFLFVVFQHRLDGRDPKLALAATSPDVLRFG